MCVDFPCTVPVESIVYVSVLLLPLPTVLRSLRAFVKYVAMFGTDFLNMTVVIIIKKKLPNLI